MDGRELPMSGYHLERRRGDSKYLLMSLIVMHTPLSIPINVDVQGVGNAHVAVVLELRAMKWRVVWVQSQ